MSEHVCGGCHDDSQRQSRILQFPFLIGLDSASRCFSRRHPLSVIGGSHERQLCTCKIDNASSARRVGQINSMMPDDGPTRFDCQAEVYQPHGSGVQRAPDRAPWHPLTMPSNVTCTQMLSRRRMDAGRRATPVWPKVGPMGRLCHGEVGRCPMLRRQTHEGRARAGPLSRTRCRERQIPLYVPGANVAPVHVLVGSLGTAARAQREFERVRAHRSWTHNILRCCQGGSWLPR